MHEQIFSEGSRRLYVSVTGIDKKSGAVSAPDFRLTFYAVDTIPIVRPLFTSHLTLDGAAQLYSFLNSISVLRDRTASVSGRFVEIDANISKEALTAIFERSDLVSNPDLIRTLLSLNLDLCRTFIETEVTAVDISGLAYRRKQLEIMNNLLHDEEFFALYQAELDAKGKEATWQRFFEQNQWILGYSLNYVIGEGVQRNKLEQVVAGYSITGSGKRVDALLHSRGVL